MYSTQKKKDKQKQNKQTKYKAKKKKLKKSKKRKTFVVGRCLLVLLQVLPLAKESGEGVPTDKLEQ